MKRFSHRFVWGLVCSLCACLGTQQSAHAQPVQLNTQEIFLLPNDLAFIAKSGNVPFRNRRAVIPRDAEPVTGTYWLKPGGNFRITQTAFAMDTVYRQRESRDFFSVLKANVGKTATVAYAIGDKLEDVTGEILPFRPGDELIRIKQPYGNTTFLHKDQLRQVAVQGDANTHYYEAELGEATLLEINRDLATAPIQVSYYVRGLKWRPQYRIQVVNDSLAELTVVANVRNDAEDFANTDLKFLLGDGSLNDADLAITARSLMGGGLAVGENTPAAAANPQNVTTPDLPILTAENVTLKKNARAEIPVLRKKVKAPQGYMARLPLFVDSLGRPRQPDGLLSNGNRSLLLTNSTGVPLPAGPLLMLDANERPMGQQALAAMPIDGVELVPMQTAPEIQLLSSERLQSREERAVRREDGTPMDRYTVRGSVRVDNQLGTPVVVQVTQEVLGTLNRTSVGEVRETGRSLRGNPIRTLTWQIPVKGQSQQVYTYEYTYLIPN